jgi:hypothetical protein
MTSTVHGDPVQPAVRDGFRGLLLYSIPYHLGARRLGISPRMATGAILATSPPLILNATLFRITGGAVHSPLAWLWLSLFATVPIPVLGTAAHSWHRLLCHSSEISSLFGSRAKQGQLADWFRRCYSIRLQVICAVIPSLAGLLLLAISEKPLRGLLEIRLVSYISVGWTAFLGGLVIYTLAVFTLLAYKIEGLEPENLDPWDPAFTPGLRALSGGYLLLFAFITATTGAIELIASRVPGYHHAASIRAFIVCAPVLGATVAIATGILPLRVLYRIILGGKLHTIRQIDNEIGNLSQALAQTDSNLSQLVELRAKVASAPGLPFRAPWLIPLIVTLIGPLIAFLLGQKGTR